jgi:hypothetical protein
LQTAAQSAQGGAASFLSTLASKFTQASQTGTMASLAPSGGANAGGPPPGGASGGAHGHHHHHHGGGGSGSSVSDALSAALDQVNQALNGTSTSSSSSTSATASASTDS